MLWLGTNVGLCRYDGQAFRYFMSTPENSCPLTSNYVKELREQQSVPGYLWVVTLNQQLYRFCVATSEFEAMLPLLNVSNWIKPMCRRPQQALYPVDRNQAMWVVLNDGSCVRYSYKDPTDYTLWSLEEQGKSRTLFNIYEDQKGREWLLTDRGTRIYNEGTISDFPFSMIAESGDTIFLGSKEGYQACYTESDGLRILDDTASWRFESNPDTLLQSMLRSEALLQNGDRLPNEKISSQLQDRQGNLWLMGESNLYRLSLQRRQANFLPVAPDEGIGAILRHDDHHLLYGTKRSSAIGRLSLDDGSIQYLTPSGQWSNQPTRFANGGIQCLYYTRDSSLWVGTWGDGLYRICRGEVSHYKRKDSVSISSNVVRTLYEDESERLWIGTFGGGVNLLNLKHPERGFYHSGNRLLGYPGTDYNNISSISGDGKGHIMVGTTRGLLAFKNDFKRLAEIRYHIHTRQADNPHSLPVNPVAKTFFDSNGVPYVCTYGFNASRVDLATLLSDTAYFETRYNHDFPEANAVLSGTIDKNGNIWTTSECGLQCLHGHGRCMDIYRGSDFGCNLNMTDCEMLAFPDGRMFVGANGGILTFHCDSLTKSGYRPSIVFTDIVKEDSRRLSVHLASLDYRPNPSLVHFGYILEGLKDRWHYTTQPDLEFTNLQPGHYVLRVKSTNSEGSWTDNEATLAIDIPVTWHNSWYWLLVAGVFLLMVWVAWLVSRRVSGRWLQRLKSAEKQSEEEVQSLTTLLNTERDRLSQLQQQLDETRQELQRTSVALDVAKAAAITTTDQSEDKSEAVAALQEPKTWGMSSSEIEQMEESDRLFLERIQQYVIENMHNSNLEVGELADISMVSRTSFYRRLKQLSGLSPIDFIRQQRMEYAKSLIVEGKSTISEVSYKAGFSDPKYFSKCFKKAVGLTPQEYRQMVLSEKK